MEPSENHHAEALLEAIRPLDLATFVLTECDTLGISQRQLAQAIGIGRRSLQRILEGEAQKIDALLVYKLAEFFHVSVDELVKRVVFEDSDQVEEVRRARRYGYIVRNFNLTGLRKLGFIDSVSDFESIERRVNSFFGLNSVFEYTRVLPGMALSRTKRNASDSMRRFWMSIVSAQFQHLVADAPEFDRGRLLALLPNIRVYTTDTERGFTAFIRELYKCGVVVIVESYVLQSAVYGATVEVGGRPCIVVTDQDKRYDLLWRTLAHELCHVLKDLDAIRRWGYHVSARHEPELHDEQLEARADQFSADLFLSPEKRREAVSVIDADFAVNIKAQEWRIHPSLIYGLYLDVELGSSRSKFRSSEYAKYRRSSLLPSSPALHHYFRNLEIPTWKRQSLAETVPQLQEAVGANSN